VPPGKPSKKGGVAGKKRKVLLSKRLIKNSRTHRLIKTEIHLKVDGENSKILRSYLAGEEIPALSVLTEELLKQNSPSSSPAAELQAPVDIPLRGDVGPSVPTDAGGIDDLLEREQKLLQKEQEEKALENEPKTLVTLLLILVWFLQF